MLTELWTWQHGDIGRTPGFDGSLERALASIEARAILMPGEKDLYFPPEDNEWEARHMPSAELRVIPQRVGPLRGRRRQSGRHPIYQRGAQGPARQLLDETTLNHGGGETPVGLAFPP